jgi:hypothetical protein
MLWIQLDGRIAFEFFRKAECGERALPADSAHSRATQASYIQSEVMRIKLRCSYQAFAKKHLLAYRQRLENAGYPNWFISKHFQKGHARYEGLVRQAAEGVRDLYRDRKSRRPAGVCKVKAPPGDQVLWIPRVSDKFLAEIKSAVKASRLKLQVKERAGTSLRRLLAIVPKSKPVVDRSHLTNTFPEQHDKQFWNVKDCVYRVKCRLCNSHYTGETQQKLYERFYNHCYCHNTQCNLEDSALAQHYANEHPNEERMQLELVKLYKTYGYVDRKATEAYIAQTLPNDINRVEPGGGTVPIHFIW